MKRLAATALLLLLVAGSVAGCTSGQPEVYSDHGKVIQTGVGEQFIIALEANPTTGYSWETKFDSSLLKQVGGDYEAASSKSGMVGGGGEQRFTFQALKKGETTITLIYKRPWEQKFAEQKTFTVRIK